MTAARRPAAPVGDRRCSSIGLHAAAVAGRGLAASLSRSPVDDAYSTPYETRLEVARAGRPRERPQRRVGTNPRSPTDLNHGERRAPGNDGRFQYNPDDGFAGTDTFHVPLDDDPGHHRRDVTITVSRAHGDAHPDADADADADSHTDADTAHRQPRRRPTSMPTPTPTAARRHGRRSSSCRRSVSRSRRSPTPTPDPRRSADPTPTPRPPPSAEPSAAASVRRDRRRRPGVSPTGGGLGRPGRPERAAVATSPIALRLAPADPAGLDTVGAIDIGIGVSPTFLVPTLALTVPGLLLMLAVFAQGVGALAWIPFVRRTLDDRERGRRSDAGAGRAPVEADRPRGAAAILRHGEVAERLMAALLKSAESKDFVGSNPTLSASRPRTSRSTPAGPRLRALDGLRRRPPILRATSRRAGCERDEYPSHVDPETRRLVRAGTTTTGNGPGSLRTERGRPSSRLRRRAPAIQGSADRSMVATPDRPVGHDECGIAE